MAECPKCRGQMTQGYTFLSDSGGTVRWMDGEPSFWEILKSSFRNKSSELHSRRCTQCGFVELFVNTDAKPVKTLKSLDEENEHLRSLVARLNDRVATLETIATDPAERTAREIEKLRSLPPPDEKA